MPVIWFFFRYMAEATTIVKFGFPDSSRFMFIAYAIAQLMVGLSPTKLNCSITFYGQPPDFSSVFSWALYLTQVGSGTH